jgi:hypothetical protein
LNRRLYTAQYSVVVINCDPRWPITTLAMEMWRCRWA